MRTVLDYITKQQRVFSELPFFVYLLDSSRSSVERLQFVPAGAPFIMAFSDLNKHTLLVRDSKDPLQQLINVHSEEDASHFKMYLRDLKTLGYDVSLSYAEALKFLWADERQHCRQTCYLLTAMLSSASTRLRLVIVEAIEAAGAAAFEVFTKLSIDYQKETGKELVFFGRTHKDLETGHTMGADDIEDRLRDIVLSEQERAEAAAKVDEVFRAFTAMMNELNVYAQAGRRGPPFHVPG